MFHRQRDECSVRPLWQDPRLKLQSLGGNAIEVNRGEPAHVAHENVPNDLRDDRNPPGYTGRNVGPAVVEAACNDNGDDETCKRDGNISSSFGCCCAF